jgi:hypothetical protein
LVHGVQSEIARVCASHGAWDVPGVSLEERTVALADKLWSVRGFLRKTAEDGNEGFQAWSGSTQGTAPTVVPVNVWPAA